MARRRVHVRFDDELVKRLDRLAEVDGFSRSELLRWGVAAVREAAEQLEADWASRDAYRRIPQDPALPFPSQRLAARTAPDS